MCKYYLPSFYLLDAVGPSCVNFLCFYSYFTILFYNLSAHCTLSTVVYSARKHSTKTIIGKLKPSSPSSWSQPLDFLDLRISVHFWKSKSTQNAKNCSRNFVLFGRCDSVPADCSFLDLNSARVLRKSKRLQSIISLNLAKDCSFLEF